MKSWLIVTVAALSVAAGAVADRLIFGGAVYAQETARISIGGESVYIGMPKDAALAKFAGKYTIGNLDGNRVLIGQSETGRLGVLTFDNGRLKAAERYWCDLWKDREDRDDIESLWNALHGALSQGIRTTAEIETSSSRIPDSQQDLISLRFPKRRIEVGKLHIDSKKGTNVFVSETIY